LNQIQTTAVDSDSRRFSRALRSAILWPVCVILFMAILMLMLIVMLMKVAKWSEHSYAVIAQTRTCESMVTLAQSELRGFVLSGDNRAFPALFKQRRSDADAAFAKLASLVQDNPQQEIRAEGLIRTKNIWFDHAQGTLNQRLQGIVSSPDWLKMGVDLMESLRGQFSTFSQVEETLHDQRLSRLQAAKKAFGFAGGGLALVLALTVGQLVRRQFMELAVDYRSALHTIEQRHTALIRSEADLEKQKEWFRVTLTSIGDGVIVADPEGRIVFMNHEAERLTGWNGVEVLLKPISSVFRLINENSREKEELPVARAFHEQKVVALPKQTLLLSKTGEEWPIEDSTAPIHDAKGAVLGVVLVFRNATDARRAQNALRSHSEDLERRVTERTTALRQTVSELEAFSYTVSHDLRSPLRAMQGFAQAVLEDYGEKLDEQGRNYLERIKNAAERLDRLIQDLLSYTRISRQEAPLAALDLDKLLRELIQHYPNLHPPAAEVKIDGPLPRVLGHEASLTQVFSNLLGNAAKFVPSGVSPQIHVWSEDVNGDARLWIEDNGIGIPPEDYERIFQMFVQVNESQLYGGTGVGLAIVKKAVESMQGKVGLVAGEKGGSRFWVEFAKAP
jgi:PAS domain S-box-containing protein